VIQKYFYRFVNVFVLPAYILNDIEYVDALSLGKAASMISRTLVAASTKPIVLAVLSQGENYGYQIIQNVKEISRGELGWSEPMLYPVLQRLEKDGFVKAKWKVGESGRFRRYYRLTESGFAELERERNQWIAVQSTFVRALAMKKRVLA